MTSEDKEDYNAYRRRRHTLREEARHVEVSERFEDELASEYAALLLRKEYWRQWRRKQPSTPYDKAARLARLAKESSTERQLRLERLRTYERMRTACMTPQQLQEMAFKSRMSCIGRNWTCRRARRLLHIQDVFGSYRCYV